MAAQSAADQGKAKEAERVQREEVQLLRRQQDAEFRQSELVDELKDLVKGRDRSLELLREQEALANRSLGPGGEGGANFKIRQDDGSGLEPTQNWKMG